MERLICILTFFLFSMILLINIAADFTEYTWKRNFLIPNGMALALIGITIFEILFEARARYLYLYAPIFVLMTGYTIKGGTSGHEK